MFIVLNVMFHIIEDLECLTVLGMMLEQVETFVANHIVLSLLFDIQKIYIVQLF